jgi:hypothetical protein
MIPKKPAPDLILGGYRLFGKRSCSKKKLERDDNSKRSHHALMRSRSPPQLAAIMSGLAQRTGEQTFARHLFPGVG